LTHWAESHKPAAAVPTQLMLAWLMWAVVGAGLACFGAWWLWAATPVAAPWVAAGAVTVGVVKSRLVLDRAARRVVDRIRARGDFLSLRTWGLVVLMMAAGRLLRGTLAHGIVGPLYIAVGTALCLSSRLSWHAWRESFRRS
jgi:hypothetical protein